MVVQFHNGAVLFDTVAVAFHADCCCDATPGSCPYHGPGEPAGPDPLYIKTADQIDLTFSANTPIITTANGGDHIFDDRWAPDALACSWWTFAQFPFGWRTGELWRILNQNISLDDGVAWELSMTFDGTGGNPIGLWKHVGPNPVGLYTWDSGDVGAIGENITVVDAL